MGFILGYSGNPLPYDLPFIVALTGKIMVDPCTVIHIDYVIYRVVLMGIYGKTMETIKL